MRLFPDTRRSFAGIFENLMTFFDTVKPKIEPGFIWKLIMVLQYPATT